MDAADDDAPTSTDETTEAGGRDDRRLGGPRLAEFRTHDISEVDSIESAEESPRIDLGSLILSPLPGSELRLQVAEETGEIVSAMLVIETIVEPPASANQQPQAYSSHLSWERTQLPAVAGSGQSCGMRSPPLRGRRHRIARRGPFGVELRRLIPVTRPTARRISASRMWVAEGPRWLLRGIVYGQAAIEDDTDSPVVADVLAAFRQVIVRRGDEAMAPGDLLLTMPTNVSQEPEEP